MVAFGKLLRRARETRGVSIYKMVDDLRMAGQKESWGHLRSLEAGLTEPGLSTILKLASYLGIEPATLLPPKGTVDNDTAKRAPARAVRA